MSDLCSPRVDVASMLSGARTALFQGNWTAAELLLRSAVDADPAPRQRIALGRLLRLRGESPAALAQLLPAWETAKKTGSAGLRASACGEIAAVHRQSGDALQARQFQLLAYAAAVEALQRGEISALPDEFRLANACDLATLGETARALDDLQRLVRGAVSAEVRAGAALELARMHANAGRIGAALNWARIALRSCSRTRCLAGRLSALELQGELYCRRGDWDRAETCCDRGLTVARRIRHAARITELEKRLRRLRHVRGLLTSDPRLN